MDAYSGSRSVRESEGHNIQHAGLYGGLEMVDKQVKLAQGTILTKKNRPVGHKTHVLDTLQNQTEQPGKWISSVGKLALGKEENECGTLAEVRDACVTDQARSSPSQFPILPLP